MAYDCFTAQATNSTGLGYITGGIGDCMSFYLGGPVFVGIAFLAFFCAFLFLQNTRSDFKLMILVPITILSMMWFSWIYAIMLMIGAYVLYRIVQYKVSG
jgi:hypothetical protein